RVFVEGAQVGVQPVGATHAGHQGQIQRCSAEPDLGVGRLHADLHVIADLGIGEDDVFHHDFFRNAQVVGDTLIALELGAVAAHAVVGEGFQTVLHRRLVGQVDIHLVHAS